MTPDLRWEIPQTMDTIDPQSPHYNAKSAYAKTLRRDGKAWGDVPEPANCKRKLAHDNSNISCQVCHSSWATSCFGCHLPMRANQRVPLNKFEGMTTRNFTSYNPQVVRDDVFQLGIDATYKNHRSQCCVLRARCWSVRRTPTASGFIPSSRPSAPRATVARPSIRISLTQPVARARRRNCADCHVSKDNDNNAWLAQMLGFGTGTSDFFGRYAYVGEGNGGLDAVVWTRTGGAAGARQPLAQTRLSSNYLNHVEKNKGELKEAYHHHGKEILDLTLRGEYLYTANGLTALKFRCSQH